MFKDLGEQDEPQDLKSLLAKSDPINLNEDPDKALAINDIIRVCKILLHKYNLSQMRNKANMHETVKNLSQEMDG